MLMVSTGGEICPRVIARIIISHICVLIVVYAAGAARALTLFLVIFFALEGILKIYFALRLRPEVGLDMGADQRDHLSVHRLCSLGAAVWLTSGQRDGGDGPVL